MSEDRTRTRSSGYTYKDAGVDINAGNALVDAIRPLAARTARLGADAALGGFGALFDLKATGYRDPVLVAATDGVGTKLKIAIESGLHDTVGIDLVAMCVNDLVVQGAEPLFFLDYFASGTLDVTVATKVVSGIARGCSEAGAALIGGETAELPGLYREGDYDLAGFSVGAVERDCILPRSDVAPDDIILGLGSSGPHSNGYSLIRRIVDDMKLAYDAPAPFDSKRSLGEALLTPTRIYVASVLAALKGGQGIKALAHITGGGITENVPRVLPADLAASIALEAIEVPPVFRWLASAGRIAEAEMLRTFNCGIGLAIVVGRDEASNVAATLNSSGERVIEVGRIVPRDNGAGVTYDGRLQLRD